MIRGTEATIQPRTPAMLDGMAGEPNVVAQMQRDARVSAEMELIENYIGGAAEARYRKCSVIAALLMGGDGDLVQARRTLNIWYPDPNARRIADTWATQRAAALVRAVRGWVAGNHCPGDCPYGARRSAMERS